MSLSLLVGWLIRNQRIHGVKPKEICRRRYPAVNSSYNKLICVPSFFVPGSNYNREASKVKFNRHEKLKFPGETWNFLKCMKQSCKKMILHKLTPTENRALRQTLGTTAGKKNYIANASSKDRFSVFND